MSGSPTTPLLLVVGRDSTPQSELAAQWAATQALRQGGRLELLTGVPLPARPMTPVPPADESPDWAASALAHDARRLRVQLGDGLEVTTCVVEDGPGPAMVRRSRAADMLVLGSAGHLGPLGALSGSVSRHCVHHAHCAVVVVGPEAGARPVARIVVSDSLDPRGATFAWAVEHAQRIGVGLHLLDAWHVDPLLPLDEQEVASIRRQTQADHERALTSLRALTSRGVRLTDEIRTGYARDVIQARTRPEDLLVVPHDRLRGISFTHARGPVAVLPPGVATSARGRVVTRTAAGSS